MYFVFGTLNAYIISSNTQPRRPWAKHEKETKMEIYTVIWGSVPDLTTDDLAAAEQRVFSLRYSYFPAYVWTH